MREQERTVTFYRYDSEREECVLMALAVGDSREFTGGGPCEEGFHYWSETYAYDGATVTLESETRSRDCDGPHDSYASLECPVERVSAHRNDYTGLMMPDWERVSAHQRDHYAEAMGY